MNNRSPDLFILTASCPDDLENIVREKFWRSVYEHDADRYLEACAFADRMHDTGYFVEYSEVKQ